jgi:hypothetical protein
MAKNLFFVDKTKDALRPSCISIIAQEADFVKKNDLEDLSGLIDLKTGMCNMLLIIRLGEARRSGTWLEPANAS